MLHALAARITTATPAPDPTQRPGWMSDLGESVTSQSSGGVNWGFIGIVVGVLITAAILWLSLSQGFSAGKGDVNKAKNQGLVMSSAVGWAIVGAVIGGGTILSAVGLIAMNLFN